jgi:hypothetical protein
MKTGDLEHVRSRHATYLVHADGALPNLALMRLGSWLRARGETVRLLRKPSDYSGMLDPKPARVFGSSIFNFSGDIRRKFENVLGPITWGGTGVRVESSLSEVADDVEAAPLDYSLYPDFDASIGFLTRGCRLKCGFCVVPKKEGKPRVAASVRELWRGEPYPRHLHLLDNDAFAPQLRSHWADAVREIREGGFRVCFSQGINLRLVDDEAASAIAGIHYTGTDFKKRRLYTAWDNLGDEGIFRRGIATLERYGISAKRLTVYMLVGYAPRETWEAVFYRFRELVEMGCEPYPMVYRREDDDGNDARPSEASLRAFQRYCVLHFYRRMPFHSYGGPGLGDTRLTPGVRAEVKAAWDRVHVHGWKPARLPIAEVA